VSGNANNELFENLISKERLAKELGLSPRTIANWVSLGRIPALRVGRKYWLMKSSVDDWLRKRETTRKPVKRKAYKDVRL
jgi:excisionase family DNA binding protein